VQGLKLSVYLIAKLNICDAFSFLIINKRLKMNKFFILVFSIFLFNSQFVIAEDDSYCQYEIAVELCLEHKEAGFIAGKTAIESNKYKSDEVLLLKEIMCLCIVPSEHDKYLYKIADEVTKESSSPLYIGIAWYHKGEITSKKGDYKNSVIYVDIALNALKKAEYEAAEGNTSFREIFEGMCHLVKRDSYKGLEDKKGYESEQEILKTYKWLSKKTL
jgi:hypothetical protein